MGAEQSAEWASTTTRELERRLPMPNVELFFRSNYFERFMVPKTGPVTAALLRLGENRKKKIKRKDPKGKTMAIVKEHKKCVEKVEFEIKKEALNIGKWKSKTVESENRSIEIAKYDLLLTETEDCAEIESNPGYNPPRSQSTYDPANDNLN